jgi:predicted deacetylase
MKLLVSIHDVTPALERDVRTLWDLCAERGITPALFVVPNWHGAWPLEEYPRFTAWLGAKARAGAEIFLHGERHDEHGLPRTFGDHLRAFGATAREGEFLTLDERQASERIARGVCTLRRAGLDPIGFVAPAWLAREATYRAVRDAGLAISEDVGTIRLHGRATRLPSPVIRWSGRTPLRAHLSAAVADARWLAERHHWLTRIALHPSDLRHPATAASMAAHLNRWRADRYQHRYAQL